MLQHRLFEFQYGCLSEVFISIELFNILLHYSHKPHCILLEFHVIHQLKVVHNGEVKQKHFQVLFYKKKSKCALHLC